MVEARGASTTSFGAHAAGKRKSWSKAEVSQALNEARRRDLPGLLLAQRERRLDDYLLGYLEGGGEEQVTA